MSIRRNFKRFSGVSTANAIGTASTDGLSKYKLCYTTVKYSGSPTQAGVTTTLNSGVGSAYDSTLNTGSANATTTNYIPDGDVIILPGDTIDVSAPAGGGSLTSAIVIVVEYYD